MIAKKNKCSQVIECSALTGENVQEVRFLMLNNNGMHVFFFQSINFQITEQVFQEAVKAALKINTKNNQFCCLL